ncbi:MAG: L-threonylcarbamoyladenylate synthase [Spirochaetales bacterium]|nr:L-threonylcarbamoyladenylate synthase [Spirochaetales bacterium]
MIEYIIPGNIDDRVLKRAALILEDGGLVAHPTDTTWHVSCSSSSLKGIARLAHLRGGNQGLLTLMTADISQASAFAEIGTPQYKVMRRLTPGPYVFILEATRTLRKRCGMKRREVGVRITEHPVATALANTLGVPLFTTTAARTMDDESWWDPVFAEENLFSMGWEIEDIPGVDLVLDGGDDLTKVLTTVLDLTHDEMHIIREGAGVLT